MLRREEIDQGEMLRREEIDHGGMLRREEIDHGRMPRREQCDQGGIRESCVTLLSRTIFVGQLPWDITREDIREVLRPYGKVSSKSCV